MVIAYTMEARENFDATNKAFVDGGLVNTAPYNQLVNTDNQVVGTAFDFARNKIMYVAFNGLSTDGNAGDYFNLTGLTLWDGTQAYAPGAKLNLYSNLSPYLGEKDVFTDAVVWHPTYDPTRIVPGSLGPGSNFFTGQVYKAVVSNGGAGYTHASATISGGGGSGATATVSVGTTSVVASAFPDSSNSIQLYFAVLPSGQAFIPSAQVTQSTFPYSDGSYSVLFHDTGGGGPYTNIGAVSYTVTTQSIPVGDPPTVTILNFNLAATVTYNSFLLSGTIYEVDVTQTFPGQVRSITITARGMNYTSQPSIAISGDGAGATAIVYADAAMTTPGTWARLGRDYFPGGGNNPVIIDPHPGANQSNAWVHSESCQLNQFRYSDNFAQVISPYIYRSVIDASSAPMVRPFGVDETWMYCLITPDLTPTPIIALVIIPAAITADEITYDYKLAYAIYTSTPFIQSSSISDLGARTVLGTDGNLYLFSIYGDADNELNFRLTQFIPPPFSAYIAGSNIAGGSFTDVTPWDATHGPNLDGENYANTPGPAPSWFSYISFFRLPAANNEAVAICKFLKEQLVGGSTDYTKTFFSCVNMKLGGSPSYDYHSAFVTGYMTAAWVSAGSIPATGYAVLDYRELDIYLDQTDYVYPPKTNVFSGDYSKRWLYFDCYPIVGSTVITAGGPKIVMVQYQFIYGQAPKVLQVIPEDGWDATYASYGAAIGKSFVVENSLWQDNAYGGSSGYVSIMRDAGITLGTDAAPVWWWAGQVDINQDAAANNMFLLNPAFAARAALNPPTTSDFNILTPIDAPFLRLTYGGTPGPNPNELYCIPFCIGATYCSEGQILRPLTPQETMTRSGPSLGKYRRMTDAMPRFYATQGVSMGVDFLKMRPLEFKSLGGTVPLTLQQLYSGTYKGQVDAQSNFDNLWCWQVCRPYPCTVVAVECQLQTNENL